MTRVSPRVVNGLGVPGFWEWVVNHIIPKFTCYQNVLLWELTIYAGHQDLQEGFTEIGTFECGLEGWVGVCQMENLRGKQGVLGEPVVWNSSGGGAMMEKQEMKQHVSSSKSTAGWGSGSPTFGLSWQHWESSRDFLFLSFCYESLKSLFILIRIMQTTRGPALHMP